MENNNLIWKSSVQKAFYGLLAYTLLSGILYTIIDMVADQPLPIIVSILALVGYIYYFLGVKGMKASAVGSVMEKGAASLYTGTLLALIGAVVDVVPLMGWIATIIKVIGFFIMMSGFNNLRKVATNPLAAKGAKQLWIMMILTIVALILGLIPVLGDIVVLLISIATAILTFLGWKNFSNSEL